MRVCITQMWNGFFVATDLQRTTIRTEELRLGATTTGCHQTVRVHCEIVFGCVCERVHPTGRVGDDLRAAVLLPVCEACVY